MSFTASVLILGDEGDNFYIIDSEEVEVCSYFFWYLRDSLRKKNTFKLRVFIVCQ